MKNKEEVIGTERSSSVKKKPKKRKLSKSMIEEKSDVEVQESNDEVKAEKKAIFVQVEESKEKLPKKDSAINEKMAPEKGAAAEVKVEEKEDPTLDETQTLTGVKNSNEEEALKAEDKKGESVNKDSKAENSESIEAEKQKNKQPHNNGDELANEDFTKYTKPQFIELVKKLSKHSDPLYAERYLKQLDPFFEEIRKSEIKKAKSAYKKENGSEEGFSFNADELINRFDANSRLINDRKYAFVKEREAKRQINLKKAEETLERLRDFVDSEESSASFNKIKEIQSEWKSIGDVPGQHSKTLWANYNALINRFYDQRSIYFELKELDRKKNYESKVKICERAEALEDFENLKDAINTLNDLHHEYKHLGPVPRELQEDLWVRFKAASDKVYKKRKEFVTVLKVVLHENLNKKEELVESIKLFVDFDSDRIKAWNAKTKEILELQKKWELIGGLPREKSKEINKGFWSNFKMFFHNKGNFFKKLDEERKGNYDTKLVLVEKAELLKNNTDWFKTANEFKTLQQDWKAIGPVPEKVRNEVYEKFKTACDFFFNNKRSNSKDEEKSYKENLKLKKEIIDQIRDWTSEADNNIEEFKAKAKEFSSLGFVPRKDINSIKEKYSESMDAFISALSTTEDDKNTLRMEIEIGNILGSKYSERALYGKEQNLRRQIQQLENDVSLWKNNLEFFANSKNADNLRKDVNLKIDKAESKVVTLKGQLKILRSV